MKGTQVVTTVSKHAQLEGADVDVKSVFVAVEVTVSVPGSSELSFKIISANTPLLTFAAAGECAGIFVVKVTVVVS